MLYRIFIFIAVLYVALIFNVLLFHGLSGTFHSSRTLGISKGASVDPGVSSSQYVTGKTEKQGSQLATERIHQEASGTEERCGLHRHKAVNCSRILQYDLEYIATVRSVELVPESPGCRLQRLVQDCSRFVSAHGYHQIPITPEEELFPLAFAIKMHKSPEQAEVLLRNIYRRHNAYCIYVDKKSPEEVFASMKNIAKCLDNVIVIEDRENIVYSSSAHVRSELACMKALLKSPVKWHYYINLAGQEFPLRTNFEMVKILRSIDGLNDIETYDLPVFLNWRVNHKYSVRGNSLADVGEKKPFKYNLSLSKGSAYGMFSRQFVEFVLTDSVAMEFINWLNDTYSPEENVWATLVTLPWAPGGYFVEVRHLLNTFMSRATIWSSDDPKCHGNYVRSVCVYGLGDLKWLTGRPEFVANKFDVEDQDPSVLDCLEEWYRQRALQPHGTRIRWEFYTNLPHVQHFRSLSRQERKRNRTEAKRLKEEWLKGH